MAFHPVRNHLAYIQGQTLCILDFTENKEEPLKQLLSASGSLTSLAYNKDGTVLIVGTDNGRLLSVDVGDLYKRDPANPLEKTQKVWKQTRCV